MSRQGVNCAVSFLRLPLTGLIVLYCGRAHAGMTVYDLNDVVRLRLEDISFFVVLLLVCGLGVKLLWNSFAKDFPRLPRLTFLRALSLTGLLGLAMLLVLVMISGARELLTPGAWHRQGSQYRANEQGNMEARQRSMESLRIALMQYATSHDGHFPPHDYATEIPEKLWQTPDIRGSRYIYVGSGLLNQTNELLAYEPPTLGDERLVLFADGTIQTHSAAEIRKFLGAASH